MFAATDQHRSGLHIEDHGLTQYNSELELQRFVFRQLIDAEKTGEHVAERIFLTEHKPVYTLGKYGHAENLLYSEESLKAEGVDVVRIERGGDITFHGLGQLVVYPIINLKFRKLGVKEYVSILEQSVIDFLSGYGVKGERVDGATGVWIDKGTPRERKICAIGVKCSHFITMHGLALNINTNLSYFNRINPCGFTDKGVTSLKLEIGREIPIQEAKDKLGIILADLLSEKL